ncbi:transposase domain-containing protein [Halomonas campaniensis]|uniref:DNA-binding protein n=1 Tax=Halomonas campaniensis TaxID=213554 RepID=A0A246S1D7_9GAMM|nr:transposase domain-containing protein [Halomonas campaniensis]OWV30166.1 DNA-binding protein [Halomonas campaniensis]
MSDWYSAKELAGLPGMPDTHSAVVRRAKRDGWQERKRTGKGGGKEYSLNSLPLETQTALLKQQAPAPVTRPKSIAATVDRESLWDAYERKPQSVKDEAARRLQALQAVERLVDNGAGKVTAVDQVAAVYGESRATLYRWQGFVKGADTSDWLALLAPGYQGRTATAEWDVAAWEFFKSMFLRYEGPTEAVCYDLLQEAAAKHGWKVPSLRTVNRRVKEIPLTVRVLAREGEYAMMRLYPSQQRTVRDLHALYWINGDGYQHNVFVKFPDGSIGRPKTWFFQDIYSRRIVGYRTDRTEHTDVIRLALGDVIERYGIPEHCTIDNTRAAANKWMTGGVKNRYRFKIKEEDPMGLMPQLGIQVHWTTVHNGRGHGQAKPIERAFGVGGLGEYVDKHPKFSGAYTGENPMAKPENYAETAVDWEVFAEVLADRIRAWNAKTGRRSEACGGQLSYAQAFDDSYQRNTHRIRRATAAQRRMWLLAAESVLVQRDSSMSLSVGSGPQGKNRYGADCLINYIGKRVVVRFDPDQLHEQVHVYQNDGRYIGTADCIHAAGFGDTSKGREWRRLHTQRLKAGKQAKQAEVAQSALEAAQYLPTPEPEDHTPIQSDVTRGSFGERKRVVGSDVVESDDEDAAETYGFHEHIVSQHAKWKKQQL